MQDTNTKRTALITGASSGFGRLAAEKLLKTGKWIVYAAARRAEKMKDLQAMGARIIKMDVTLADEVNLGVARIIKEQGRIDALLANAGYGTYGTIECVPMEEIRHQYDVNVFGTARVIKAVLPQMRKQRSGRIVITSSIVSRVSVLGMGWYASTKHAVKAIAEALRQEVKGLGIDVVMIEPGAVRTEFDDVAFKTLHKVEHPDDYRDIMDGFERFMTHAYSSCGGPGSTARCMVRALTAKRPRAVYRPTMDAKLFGAIRPVIPDGMLDKMVLSIIKK